jgi:hypothetical protein
MTVPPALTQGPIFDPHFIVLGGVGNGGKEKGDSVTQSHRGCIASDPDGY